MKFGSVCSGIEAASIAWEPLGWSAAWLSEIEPFPCSVLAHHWPDVPNLGDMTTIVPRILSGEVEAPDVFTGGTPCQAFSVAGKRGSLSDDRGNLSLTFCEIANAVDDVRSARGEDAAIIVWENVPGVLSTSDNAFGCFLAGLAGDDQPIEPGPRPEPGRSSAHWTWKKDAAEHRAKWPKSGVVVGPRRTVAWRVLGAQYFGLAQRRERVFVVASARNGFNPGAVLFEFDGVRRDSPPSREAGQGPAAGTLRCTDGGSDVDHACAGHLHPCWWDGGQVSQTLDAVLHKGQTMPEKNRFPAVLTPALSIHENQRAEVTLNDTCGAIKCSGGKPEQGYPAVLAVHGTQDPNIRHDQAHTLGRNSGQENAVCVTGEVTHTLKDDGFDGSEDGTGRGQPIVAFGLTTEQTPKFAKDMAMTLTKQSPTGGGQPQACMTPAMLVRRLTPVECERLQGFPDSHTLVPHRGKPAKDGPRYKAIGNSWAVPCARWIGKRIQLALVLGSPSAPDFLL